MAVVDADRAAISDESIGTPRSLYTRMGKRPVIIQKELPGFIDRSSHSAEEPRLRGARALLEIARWP